MDRSRADGGRRDGFAGHVHSSRARRDSRRLRESGGSHRRADPVAARGLREVGASHRPPRGKAHPARGKAGRDGGEGRAHRRNPCTAVDARPRGNACPGRARRGARDAVASAFAAGQARDGWPDQAGEAAAGAASALAWRLPAPREIERTLRTCGAIRRAAMLHGRGSRKQGRTDPIVALDKGESGPRLDSNSLSPPS